MINSEHKLNANCKEISLSLNEDNNSLSEKKINDKYEIHELLGKGSFGEVYRGTDKFNNQYAIKFEHTSNYKNHLEMENKIYDSLKNNKHFHKIYYYGNFKNYRILIMDKLGISLKQIFLQIGIFDINTVSNIAVQILYILQELHYNGWLHQDIKPENILIDSKNGKKLYLVDYGTSSSWRDESNNHIVKKKSNRIVGTVRYSCISNHYGMTQCRCDDLESLGYVLLYFMLGELPWQGIKCKNNKIKWNKVLKIKQKINISKYCIKKKLSECFHLYFDKIFKLEFDETPNYKELRQYFRKNIKSDFFWTKLN